MHQYITASLFLASCMASTLFGQTALDDPIPTPIGASPVTVVLEEVASGLAFPTDLAASPDDTGRLFVTELFSGQIKIIQNGTVLGTPYLDIAAQVPGTVSTGDYGTTSLAFHPGFADAGSAGLGKFYTISSEANGTGVPHFGAGFTNHQNVVYEWQVTDPTSNTVPDTVAPREILRISQPRAEHNVNDLAFDNDGLLYISIGDGGNTPAFAANGQDRTNPFGSILRIDIDDTTGNGRYSIPESNPFEDNLDGHLEEIYAYGLRNPYRISVDHQTNTLYAGDVGQLDIEEVNRVELGLNYGWNEMEGSFARVSGGVSDDLSGLPAGFDGVNPLGEYDHDEGRSITGGFIYRGDLIPSLTADYVFGDFAVGRLFELDATTGVIREMGVSGSGASLPSNILGFGEDTFDELYLLGTDGRVLKIVPEPHAIIMLLAACPLVCRRDRRTRNRLPA